MIPEETEEYEIQRRPEVVLLALWLLHYYMNRTPGRPRPALPRYAIAMASRILGLHGVNEHWAMGDYVDERLSRFGLDPTTHQVVDKQRWAVAWKIVTGHRKARGCPWRISAEEFEKAYDEAMRQPGNIPEAAPIYITHVRAKNRPYKGSWDVKKFKSKEPVKPSFYRQQRLFQSRVKRYFAELEES
jgi:hypothetical protein